MFLSVFGAATAQNPVFLCVLGAPKAQSLVFLRVFGGPRVQNLVFHVFSGLMERWIRDVIRRSGEFDQTFEENDETLMPTITERGIRDVIRRAERRPSRRRPNSQKPRFQKLCRSREAYRDVVMASYVHLFGTRAGRQTPTVQASSSIHHHPHIHLYSHHPSIIRPPAGHHPSIIIHPPFTHLSRIHELAIHQRLIIHPSISGRAGGR